MIVSLSIGLLLGCLYAWSAHMQHSSLLSLSGGITRPFFVFTTLVRTLVTALVLALVGTFIGITTTLLCSIVVGYGLAMTVLCRRQ